MRFGGCTGWRECTDWRETMIYHFIWYFMHRCIGWITSTLGITTDLYHNIFFLHHGTHSNECMALLFPPFSYLKSNSALKASRDNLSRNSFVWLFLLSSHERMGICPCLVLVFQQVLLSVYSSFRLPLMKAEQWHCILHRQQGCQRFRPFSGSAPRGFGPFPVRPFSSSALLYFFALFPVELR